MDQERKPPTDDRSVFFLGSPGLVSMVVCAPAAMTREQIAVEVNIKSPTGLEGGWVVTDEADLPEDERDEIIAEGYPRACPDGGRLHYMVHC